MVVNCTPVFVFGIRLLIKQCLLLAYFLFEVIIYIIEANVSTTEPNT